MRQAVLTKPETIEMSEIEQPKAGKGQVLMKVDYVGICGSDIHAYYGKHPFMSFPIRLGHEMAGKIVEIGEGVTGLAIGDEITVMPQVFCGECEQCKSGRYNICNTLKVIGCQTPGAAADYLEVDANLVKKLPAGMTTRQGATVEPAAVGVHAVRRKSVKGLNVVVMGAGTIGNVTAQAAMAEGAKSVLITDMSDYRLNLAKEQCGIPHVANTGKMSMADAIKEAFGDEGADIFFECVGIGATVNQAIECSKKGHDIIIVGVYGTHPEINMGWVQDREFSLIGTLMYLDHDFQDTIDYMASGKIKMDPLVYKEFSLEEYQEAFKFIENNKDESLKILIKVS